MLNSSFALLRNTALRVVETTPTWEHVSDRVAVGAGAGTAVLGGLTSQQIIAWGGFAVAVISMVGSLLFKYLHYRLEVRKLQQGLRHEPPSET